MHELSHACVNSCKMLSGVALAKDSRMCKSSGMKNSDELIIGVTEAAEILGISVATVTRWAQNGNLPPIRKLPGWTGAYLFDAGLVRRKAAERLLRKTG
jgi:excisionase family DNA binding protein